MLVVLVIACLIYLVFMAGKAVLSLSYAVNEEVPDKPLSGASVAILQAILSGDPNMGEILTSNLLSLPEQHFVWLCDEDDVEGIRVTDFLMEKFPELRITRLLCAPCPPEVNPKVFKLILADEVVNEPFVIVLDDDTHLPAATAAALVHHAGQSEIATGLPHYSDDAGWSSSLLAQFVNNNSAITYLSLLPFTSPLSINGMCYAMRRENMRTFREIRHHLTDDLALAIAMLKRGGRIHQSARPQRIMTEVRDVRHYFRMMHRWHLFAWLLVREQSVFQRAVIFLMHGWHPMLLWLIVLIAASEFSWLSLVVLLGFLALRSTLLVILQRWLFGGSVHRPVVSLLSELLQPVHLSHALVDRRINWRGKIYQVFGSDCFEKHE